ncbi:POK6 protein, partial [Podargus strigoides]|nr:POK6 protein [Podargus strigoides]
SITPQKVKFTPQIKTLDDLQKVLGAINWICPLLGLTTEELHPLFKLLKGDSELVSP